MGWHDRPGNFNWDAATVAWLRELWAPQPNGTVLSVAQIGLRMGISKNAVRCKAQREGLPPRENPVKRLKNADGELVKQERAKPPERLPNHVPPMVSTRVVELRQARAMATPPVHIPQRSMPCCWPMGEVKAADFRFCEAPGVAGKPYCARHCEIAYLRVGAKGLLVA